MSTTDPSAAPLDRVAFTARHRAALWRYLRVLGASAADADDLVQEAFVVALRRPDFDASSAAGVFAFLRTTARFLWMRSRKRTLDDRQLVESDAVWDASCGAGDEDGERYVEALRECVAALPPRSQELLRATYADGVGRDVAGERFGLGSDGIKSALRRLRARLHDCITRRLEGER